MSSVQVYNEWDPVEEIIVGNPLHAQVPACDLGLEAIELACGHTGPSVKPGKLPDWVIQETEEDILTFISELKKLGITVKRPDPIKFEGKFRTPDWEADSFFCYSPRDVLFAYKNMIIESPNVYRSRFFESFAYKNLLLDYFKSGAKWISAPKPRLLDEIYNTKNRKQSALNDLEPVFDAANILRAGKDIFYQVSDSGNELGCAWLQSVLGDDIRVHPCRNLYSSVHIDTTMALLRPGLVLINPTRVNDDNMPEKLKNWERIKAPEMKEYKYSDCGNQSSPWLGMNILMLAPDLAVVDSHQTELIKLLETKGIRTMPLKLRHGRTLDGGFHCITLDVRRKGKLEDYF